MKFSWKFMVKKARKKMYNLGTVLKFEVFRALKKPTFWAAIFAIPLIYGVIFGFSAISSAQTRENQEKLAKETFSFDIQDESSIVSKDIIAGMKGDVSKNKAASIAKVKDQKIDAFYFIPKDLAHEKIEIYAKNVNINENAKYSAVLKSILKNSSAKATSANQLVLINETYKTEQTIFKNGQKYEQIYEMIAPGIFLFVFYFITVFLSNRMLTSTTEEKENRVTEIILTSISARTLILGKIISIIVLGIVQILTLLLTGVVMLFLISNVGDFAKNINLPDLSTILPNIRWEFSTIAISAIILIAGFMMVTGFIVALGAMMPTAQEASNYFGMIIMTLMAPLFVLPSFFVNEPNEIVIFLSYFPLTSPISLLLRNMLGTLSFSEALVGILLLIIFAIVAIWLAVRIFRFGTIAYGSKINLKSIFSKKKIA